MEEDVHESASVGSFLARKREGEECVEEERSAPLVPLDEAFSCGR